MRIGLVMLAVHPETTPARIIHHARQPTFNTSYVWRRQAPAAGMQGWWEDRLPASS